MCGSKNRHVSLIGGDRRSEAGEVRRQPPRLVRNRGAGCRFRRPIARQISSSEVSLGQKPLRVWSRAVVNEQLLQGWLSSKKEVGWVIDAGGNL